MTFPIARALARTIALLIACSGASAAQHAYPAKPIRLISPYAPGGGNNAMARLVGHKLTERWGQQVIVDSRPGGNTMIGTDTVAKAAPDGYTLLLAGSGHVLVPLVFKAPYHPLNDFAAVAGVGKNELILVLGPAVGANTFQELVALAKAKPGQLNYATYGSGTTGHLSTELFCMMTGIRMQHIPYKGAGPAITDLLGGQVDAFLSTPPPVIPHILSGRLKGIAISGERRSPAVANVPTFAEAGLRGFEAKSWYGLLAPAKTPRPIIDKWSTEIKTVLETPDMQSKLASQAVDPYIASPEQYAALMQADTVRWLKVLKTANIKMEQ
jgi:tripartite-type tricarboxylate transporter receptor subunit TctC